MIEMGKWNFKQMLAVIYAVVGSHIINAGEAENEIKKGRIEFGNSYVMGQSIKSGAVYLTNRKSNAIESMLNLRKDYRSEILKGHALKVSKNSSHK